MFIGTKALVASASSAKKPGKNIPRGLLLSAIIIIPLYLLLALVAIGTVNPLEASQQVSLLNFAAGQIFGQYGTIVFAIAGMVACLSALGTSLSVQSSVARGMSRDGYFPKILMTVHSRFGTNYIAAIVGSCIIMILSVLGAVPFLVYAASFGSLLVFALVNLSLMKLRKAKPYMDRPFKTPFYPLTPIFGFILSLAMLVTPMIFGDGNGLDALASGLGLTAIVLSSYYLRMMGRYRVQVALGGIGIGSGAIAALLTILSIIGIIQPIFPFINSNIQLVISFVLIIAGAFNLNAGPTKKNTGKK
jgi:amino acid transporter